MLKNDIKLLDDKYYQKMNNFKRIIKDLTKKLKEKNSLCDEKNKDVI